MNAAPRGDTSLIGWWWITVDRWLLAALLVLMAVGVVMAFAASPPVAARLNYDRFYFVHRQISLIPFALFLLLAVSLLAPTGVLRAAVSLFVIGLALTVTTLVAAPEVKGAQRWLEIWGVSLQPSELIKPGFAVLTGFLLAQRRDLLSALLLVLVVAVLIRQPDIGMALTVAMVWFAQYFLAGLSLFWVGAMIALGVAALTTSYFTSYPPHVRERIDQFLDSSAGDTYQIDLSLQAFASGGLYGRGPGEGLVKEYLPDAHADFVFAVAGEEFGLLACLMLIGVFAFVVVRGIMHLTAENNRFVVLAAAGLITHFGLQAMINMAVALRLVPTKGLTLPFISYGGSSLLAMAVATGMILALTRWRHDAGAES